MQPQIGPLRNPLLRPVAHLIEVEVIPELGFVSLVDLVEAVRSHDHPNPRDHHPA
jgi:hypothetical protein